jgi:hypothetical protein
MFILPEVTAATKKVRKPSVFSRARFAAAECVRATGEVSIDSQLLSCCSVLVGFAYWTGSQWARRV